MKQWQWLIVATFFIWGNAAKAQERIQFRSLDSSATVLDGYLYPSIGAGRRPAVVFLHGCSGMFDRSTGLISRLERDWASVLNGDGYSVLMVDSFRPRSIDQTCAPATYNPAVVAARPKDAYGALYYLQNQSFVRGDRIALIGWSAGGGTVLRTIPQQSEGRPASCRKAISGPRWRSIQRCVAISEKRDRGPATSHCWSCSAQPMCGRRLPHARTLSLARSRAAPRIELHIYPGAYHAFDAPDRPLRRLPEYTTTAGVVPIVGTNPAARRDAFAEVQAFLRRYLGD